MVQAATESGLDPRIHVSADHLRRLGGQARAITLLPRQPAGSILNGRHASRLRGRGLNFEELRGYVDGDDIRTIDWKVTARTGEPHVRVYTEERDRPTLLVVDQRMSMFFGSKVYMKSVIAAEVAALAAHRVLGQGDRVGGLVFGDDRIAEHRPQRSRLALNRFLNSIADANGLLDANAPAKAAMPLNQVLGSAVRIAKTSGLVLVFSDFDGIDEKTEPLIAALARSNDLILFNVSDPLAEELPENLKMTVSDGELQAELDADAGATRQRIAEMSSGRVAGGVQLGPQIRSSGSATDDHGTSARPDPPPAWSRRAKPMTEEFQGLGLVELINLLEEVPEPPPIAMTPQTPGWIVLGVVVAVLLFLLLRWAVQRHRAEAYRRAALRELEQAGDDPAAISTVLRRTALAAFPAGAGRSTHRSRLAGFSGSLV